MKLRVLNSNSDGNCYLLEGKNSTLILECGVRFATVKQALKFDLSRVAGALLTHEHGDHSCAVRDFISAGINIYCSEGTRSCIVAPGHRVKAVEPNKVFQVGEFSVYPFDVQHDAKQPFGFLIKHPECGSVLFITDSYYVKYKFSGLTHVLIEANYCEEIVYERMLAGTINKHVKDRVIQSHMSLQTCKKLLSDNDLRGVANIVLLHLSDGNSDAKKFLREVKEQTGKKVFIAEKGLELPLGETPF